MPCFLEEMNASGITAEQPHLFISKSMTGARKKPGACSCRAGDNAQTSPSPWMCADCIRIYSLEGWQSHGNQHLLPGLPVPSPLHTSSLIAQSHFRKSCVSMMSWCCSSCATPACWRRCGFAGQATAPSTRSRWDTFTRACGCLGHGPPPERTLLQSLSLAGYFPSGFLHPDTDPRVGKITGRRKWQSTPVFLPGKSHGQMSLAG